MADLKALCWSVLIVSVGFSLLAFAETAPDLKKYDVWPEVVAMVEPEPIVYSWEVRALAGEQYFNADGTLRK